MFRLINGGELLPQRATRFSAGFDVFANEGVTISAGETVKVGLGIALDEEQMRSLSAHDVATHEQFMSAFYFKLCLRSSLGAKGLILPNGHGVIDMDYRDEIKMVIHNPFCGFDNNAAPMWCTGRGGYQIERGDKIGQLILCRHEGYLLPAEYTLDATRTGGFGSTGDKNAD